LKIDQDIDDKNEESKANKKGKNDDEPLTIHKNKKDSLDQKVEETERRITEQEYRKK